MDETMDEVTKVVRAANAQNSPLLSKLPPEIRNKVYRLVLVSEEPINIKPAAIRRQRSLLKTCHQIREEASTIYYGENQFYIGSRASDIFHIARFSRSKDGSIGRMISNITIPITLIPRHLEWFEHDISLLKKMNEKDRLSAHRSLVSLAASLIYYIKNALCALDVPLSVMHFTKPLGIQGVAEEVAMLMMLEAFEAELQSIKQADSD